MAAVVPQQIGSGTDEARIAQKDAAVIHTLETSSPSSEGEATQQATTAASRPKFSYQSPTVDLVDRFIDQPRPLRVAVIGGGLSGILAGVLLPKKVPGIQLTIFEKNLDLVRSHDFEPLPQIVIRLMVE
jgi:hypothetical protein